GRAAVGAGAAELDGILPRLEGRDEMEALFGRARAAFWLADADSTLRSAERAKELAEQLGDQEFLGPSLGFLSAGHGMRGHVGDIDRALELGNRAIEDWVPGARPIDLAVVKNYQANHYYWTRDYQTAAELVPTTAESDGGL